MTGIPQFNVPLFDRAARELRDRGYSIVSPAELDSQAVRDAALASKTGSHDDLLETNETWGDMLARDVKMIADHLGGIIFLPDWQKSRGARLEAFVGLLCGIEFARYCPGDDIEKLSPLTVLSQISRVTFESLRA